jgi:hypothetical protein
MSTDFPGFLFNQEYIAQGVDEIASQAKDLDQALWHKQRNEVISWIMNTIITVPNAIIGAVPGMPKNIRIPEVTPELVGSFGAVFSRIWDWVRGHRA